MWTDNHTIPVLSDTRLLVLACVGDTSKPGKTVEWREPLFWRFCCKSEVLNNCWVFDPLRLLEFIILNRMGRSGKNGEGRQKMGLPTTLCRLSIILCLWCSTEPHLCYNGLNRCNVRAYSPLALFYHILNDQTAVSYFQPFLLVLVLACWHTNRRTMQRSQAHCIQVCSCPKVTFIACYKICAMNCRIWGMQARLKILCTILGSTPMLVGNY